MLSTTITLLVMIISLIMMVVIPVLPGQFIIWLAALAYGIFAGWENLGWSLFSILTLAMIVAAVVDLVAGWWGAKKWGASNKAIVTGFVAGFVGLIVFNAFGALLGIFLGIAGYEYKLDKDLNRSLKAGGGYLIGLLVSLIVRFFIALGMVVLFWMRVA